MAAIIQSIITIVLAGSVVALVVLRIRSQNELRRINDELIESYSSFAKVLDKVSVAADSVERIVLPLLEQSSQVGSVNVKEVKRLQWGVALRCPYLDSPSVNSNERGIFLLGFPRELIPLSSHLGVKKGAAKFTFWDAPSDEWEAILAESHLRDSRILRPGYADTTDDRRSAGTEAFAY